MTEQTKRISKQYQESAIEQKQKILNEVRQSISEEMIEEAKYQVEEQLKLAHRVEVQKLKEDHKLSVEKQLKINEEQLVEKIKCDIELIFLKELTLDGTDRHIDSQSYIVRYEQFLAGVQSEVKRLQSYEAIIERGKKINDLNQNMSSQSLNSVSTNGIQRSRYGSRNRADSNPCSVTDES